MSKKPKDRIVSTAAKLFSSHGIHTTGVDKVSAEADVSKRTLYKHFPSKEALVSAAVTEIGQAWFAACTSSDANDPAERIKHVFTMVEPMAEVEDFYGCIMMNTSIELRGSDDLGVKVAREFKTKLYNYFEEQATLFNAKEPAVLAEQLVLLYDGISAWIVMRRKFPASAFQTLNLLLLHSNPLLK